MQIVSTIRMFWVLFITIIFTRQEDCGNHTLSNIIFIMPIRVYSFITNKITRNFNMELDKVELIIPINILEKYNDISVTIFSDHLQTIYLQCWRESIWINYCTVMKISEEVISLVRFNLVWICIICLIFRIHHAWSSLCCIEFLFSSSIFFSKTTIVILVTIGNHYGYYRHCKLENLIKILYDIERW